MSAMSGISLQQLMEVVETTRELVDPPSWEDISRTKQRYPAVKQIMKARRKQIRGAGHGYRWQVKVQRHAQAKFVGAFEVEQVAVKDMFVHANVPMRAAANKYAFDIMEEELNAGPEQLVDVVQARRVDAFGDLIDLMETSFWSSGIDVSDETTPWPLAHTLRPHPAATTAAGFNGGNPTGWSNKQGLDSTAYTRWNNWTGGWVDMTDVKPGFVFRVNEGIDRTRFEAPYPYPNASPEEADYGFYCGYVLRDQINQWLRRQNDNIGRDLRNFHGDPLLNNTPVMWVEEYDTDTTLPFSAVNWNVYEVLQGAGWYMKEIGPRPAPMQPTAVECFLYNMYNLICRDPSRSFKLNYVSNLSGNGLLTTQVDSTVS